MSGTGPRTPSLAGVVLLDAVIDQAMAMFLVRGASTTTSSVIALGLRRRLFTPDHRLIRVPSGVG